MGKAKKGKNRLDRYYHLAREQGYRSRAAFKLVQLDRKYGFLNSAQSLLDLCAAPGGWMQVAVKSMPVGALVIGVDLVPIRPIRGALTLQEDITTPKCASEIGKLLRQHGQTLIDVVLHDGSPNVGGAWAKEAVTQASLVLDALKLATKFLAPKGTFVTKVFRSQDYNSLLYAFGELFEKVEVTKPLASRTTSAEIYVIGLKFRAPGKIDPRLLDSRHLFQEIAGPAKVIDVLGGSKQKRHRDGYDENTTFRKDCSASDFVWAEKPLEVLGTITSISFGDPGSVAVKECSETTDEVKALCEDLRVLGKKEFKQILKWRMNVRKALSSLVKAEEAPAVAEKKTDKEEDEETLAKMEELKMLMESKNKQAKKKAAKRKQKVKARTRTGMQVDATGEEYGDTDLFSLASIKAKKQLDRVEDGAEADDDVADDSADDEILNGAEASKEDGGSDVDSDVERERYNTELEMFLDRAYDRYRSKKDGNALRRKRARMGNSQTEDLWEEDMDVLEEDVKETKKAYDGDEEEEEEEANPLVVSLPRPKLTKEEIAEQWFSQKIFAGFDGVDDETELPAGGQAPILKKSVTVPKEKDTGAAAVAAKKNGAAAPVAAEPAQEDDFEVVPVAASDSSDSSSSEDEYDSDSKAEILTYAKKMLRKKDRDKIIDDSYNKYMFNDDGLPEWFADDERRHCKIQKPFTKEEVMAMKAQFKAIDARPVKKVAEAKARKKRRVMKKMDQARTKAAAIADQSDISAKSKNRMMEKVYKKAAATVNRKPKRELVVAKKGVKVRSGKGKLLVDRRMKKDSRSKGSSGGKSKRGGGKAGGKSGRGGGKTGGKAGGKAGGRGGGKAGRGGGNSSRGGKGRSKK